jgi:hypothetical protein
MAQMIRKQVYIEPDQDAVLKKQAAMLGVTEAEVIRRAIDTQVAFLKPAVRDLHAWEREKAFIAGRIATGPVPGGRKFSRDELYAERLERYGR